MSGTKKLLIAWDSCIFLAWFKREKDKPLAEIKAILERVTSNKLSLLVSAISLAEVLDRAGESDAGSKFRGFLRRRDVILANIDHRIGVLAGNIRMAALDAKKAGKIKDSIKIPDAFVAATAVLYKADELHTFDPDLLDAANHIALLSSLRIIRPEQHDPLPLFSPR